jgi:integrase
MAMLDSTVSAQSYRYSEFEVDEAQLAVAGFLARYAALAVLLGLNGLRVSEPCATNIEDLGMERGHRALRIIGKGNKPAVIPLVLRTVRTIDLAVGERCEGPILHRRDGARLDRRTARAQSTVHPPSEDQGVPISEVIREALREHHKAS